MCVSFAINSSNSGLPGTTALAGWSVPWESIYLLPRAIRTTHPALAFGTGFVAVGTTLGSGS